MELGGGRDVDECGSRTIGGSGKEAVAREDRAQVEETGETRGGGVVGWRLGSGRRHRGTSVHDQLLTRRSSRFDSSLPHLLPLATLTQMGLPSKVEPTLWR